MSNLVERESNLTPKSTGNPIDSKISVKSNLNDGSSQGKEQFQLESPESRFLYFLANLANDELEYVDCPPKSSSDVTKIVQSDETNDSLDGYDSFGKQDETDKSKVLHKDIDAYRYYDTDDDDVNFILGNEFDTDDDTDL